MYIYYHIVHVPLFCNVRIFYTCNYCKCITKTPNIYSKIFYQEVESWCLKLFVNDRIDHVNMGANAFLFALLCIYNELIALLLRLTYTCT